MVIYEWEDIKWYEGYNDIDRMMGFLQVLENDSFAFVRIGEELTDIEIKGDPYQFDIDITVNVHF